MFSFFPCDDRRFIHVDFLHTKCCIDLLTVFGCSVLFLFFRIGRFSSVRWDVKSNCT
uniref:Uncharacterized protein n=1 Tax=Anopheles dirus TaxID=7168 RepID=A0A182NX16_9DIPT